MDKISRAGHSKCPLKGLILCIYELGFTLKNFVKKIENNCIFLNQRDSQIFMTPFWYPSSHRSSVKYDIINLIYFFNISLIDVLSTLEKEDEQVDKIFDAPPTAELDVDSDSD